ncbi:MAG: NAD(P)-dependent oxidoreductase [Chloroflexi bacterium]|nr:NAD(P)-dependent oxidoreductase [Chloroflexota bacterium]
MSLRKVGLLSPGDMGHTVGRALIEHGMPVITCLAGRSQRTQTLAKASGIESVPTYEQLVSETDMVLSILVPSEAKNAALTVAKALRATGKQMVYVDCNAIAPATVREIGEIIRSAGSRFVDVGILGAPPTREGITRFYASGADVGEFQELSRYGLDIRVAGTEIGQASGIKMTYAALTKGIAALSTELLVAAWQMGLYKPLREELRASQPELYRLMERSLLSMPTKARRWVGEMEEIARTFGDLGLTPKTYKGAADVYRFVGESSLADETPETYDKNRTLAELINILATARPGNLP